MSSRGAALVGGMAFALVASLLAAPSGPAAAAAPDPAPGRLAFTDARDAVRQVGLDLQEDAQANLYLVPQPGSSVTVEDTGRHSGEASGKLPYSQIAYDGDGSYAFVGTGGEDVPAPSTGSPSPDASASAPPSASPTPTAVSEDPDAEVWYRQRTATATSYVQVTDDDAHESHPQAWERSNDCTYGPASVDVAFASDRSGNWDIWVAHLEAESVGGGVCGPYSVIERYQVTDDPGDDLWPAWSQRRDGEDWLRTVVFSSTRTDPRGDLFEVHVQPGALEGGAAPSDLTTTQLTEGPEADSRPAPRPYNSDAQTCFEDGSDGEPSWLAFTRASEDDPRGGLAVLDLADPGAGVLSLDVSAASEPAWSPDGRFIAYRSTADDPDGDVLVGRFERTCPAPDLAVRAVEIGPSDGAAGTPIYVDDSVDVLIVVTNTGGSPAGGTVEIDFSDLLSAPAVDPPESCVQKVCTVVVPELQPGQSHERAWTADGDDPLVAVAEGSASVVARVSVTGLVTDADPGNDELSGTFEVVAPVEPLISDEGTTISQVTALGEKGTADTRVVATYAALVGFTGAHSIHPAAYALPAAGRLRTAAVPGAAPAALAPAQVPPPAKDPVEDSVALAAITPVADEFRVAESHPTFVRQPDGQLALLFTWRPNGSRVSDALSMDGSDRRVIAGDPTEQVAMGHPSYSPDGRFVAYHRWICDQEAVPTIRSSADYFTFAVAGCAITSAEIVVATADGADPVPIYSSEGLRPEGVQDLRPAWSPDGTAIAFTRIVPAPSEGRSQPPSIWVARGLDLAVEPPDLLAEDVTQLTTPHAADFEKLEIDEFDDEAAWSPDGARIAFTRARFDTAVFDGEPQSLEPGAYDTDIWVVDVASADEQPLLSLEVGAPEDDEDCPESRAVDRTGTVCRGGDDRGADWSPDGSKVVYEHTGWLYLADPKAGIDLGPVTGPRILDSADDRPVYPDDPPGSPSAPGDPASAFFPELEWAQDPSWSPNGDRIAFSGQPRGQPDQRGIYWLTLPDDPDDREIREIAQQPQPELEPDWQPTADLAITLTAVPVDILTGEGSILSAVVTNEGPAAARSASVSVTFPTGLEPGSLPAGCAAGTPVVCSLGDLPNGGTATLDFPVVGTTPGALATTAITSSRTVDPDPDDNTATATITVTRATADLSITLTAAPASILVGGDSVLTAIVTNAGPSTAQAPTVTVTFPTGLTPGPLPTGCAPGTPVVCSLGDLPNGGTATLDFPVVGTTPGALATTATTNSPTLDPDPDDNTATATITVTRATADLSITLTAAPASILVGGDSVLTAIVTNDGPSTAVAPTVTVTFPTGLTPGPLPAGCAPGTPVVCSLGDLPNASTTTRDFPVVGTTPGALATTATTNSPTLDPDPDDNTATATITVSTVPVPTADLSVTLTAGPATVQVGDGSVLTAIVSNGGPATAQAATVTMAFPDGLTPGLLPTGCVAGPPVTCTLGDLSTGATATLEFPVVGTAPGTLATLATANSITPDPDSTNNRVFAIVTVGASADVRVKLAISPSPGYVGGRVKVTVTIRNDGPTDSAVALAVRVPDDAGPPDDEDCVADTGCDLGQIAAGSKVVRTIVLAPEAALRGPVKADVTGSVADPDLSNNSDRVRLTVLQPTLQLLPPLGPPGFVTLAVGEDFPPGARVALTWDPGLNASDATLKVARDGTFDTPVVVLTRDQLGPRTILAKRTKGLKFSPVEAEFLVVPRSQAPPDFVGRG